LCFAQWQCSPGTAQSLPELQILEHLHFSSRKSSQVLAGCVGKEKDLDASRFGFVNVKTSLQPRLIEFLCWYIFFYLLSPQFWFRTIPRAVAFAANPDSASIRKVADAVFHTA